MPEPGDRPGGQLAPELLPALEPIAGLGVGRQGQVLRQEQKGPPPEYRVFLPDPDPDLEPVVEAARDWGSNEASELDVDIELLDELVQSPIPPPEAQPLRVRRTRALF